MILEVMVESRKCDEIRRKLDRFAETEPKVTNPEGLADTTVLVYDKLTMDDGEFARKAMQSGASSVRKVS